MSSASLLEQARGVHGDSRVDHRRNALLVGGLLHQYLLALLLEGAALPERQRLAARITRAAGVKAAAKALKVTSSKVCHLIHTAMLVELLAPQGLPEGPEEVSWLTLRILAPLVRRKTHPGGKHGRSDGGPVTEMEQWQPLASCNGESPQAVLARAVEQRWTVGKAKAFLKRARMRLDIGSTQDVCTADDKAAGCGKPTGHADKPFFMREAICNGTPRDLAELLVGMIERAQHPLLVLDLLEGELVSLRRRARQAALIACG